MSIVINLKEPMKNDVISGLVKAIWYEVDTVISLSSVQVLVVFLLVLWNWQCWLIFQWKKVMWYVEVQWSDRPLRKPTVTTLSPSSCYALFTP